MLSNTKPTAAELRVMRAEAAAVREQLQDDAEVIALPIPAVEPATAVAS